MITRINPQTIQSYLAGTEPLGLDPGLPTRPRLQVYGYDQLPSTNQRLWQLAAEGATAGTVAIAAVQTAGRGQWGRQWQSQTGGLYLSLLLEPDVPVQASAQLTFCSAWGIAQSLRNLEIPVGLKWPNDLVVQGRKLGGILTETQIQADRIPRAVIGVGINWHNSVPEPGITLQEVMRSADVKIVLNLEHLAAIALRGMVQGYQRWQRDGTDWLLSAYQALLHLHQSVTISGRSGKIIGVSGTGALKVYLPESASEPAAEIWVKPGTISLGYR